MTVPRAASEGPQRILVHAPRGRDAEVVCRVLETRFARPWVSESFLLTEPTSASPEKRP